MTDEERAFRDGFYAGAAQEGKDGTPYPFFPWDICYKKWLEKDRKWEGRYP